MDLGACLQQDSGCDAFKRGHCNFGEENVLANVAGNFQVEDCQVIFTFVRTVCKAKYFFSSIQESSYPFLPIFVNCL